MRGGVTGWVAKSGPYLAPKLGKPACSPALRRALTDLQSRVEIQEVSRPHNGNLKTPALGGRGGRGGGRGVRGGGCGQP